ncbi:MAG: hypothetical protein HZA50_15360 [Planctomycetes bacterium]|nr:hypothetical protein [Planctomycetota bacterium]
MAYTTSKEQRRQIKDSVLNKITLGVKYRACGREMYAIASVQVHARYCAEGSGNFKFNINPNTLRSDYELWICGDTSHWYLIPVRVIKAMYDHPEAYPDKLHPEIRVVSVDMRDHSAVYASPSIKQDLCPYYQAKLPSTTPS